MPQCAVPIPHLMTRQTDRQQYGMLLLPGTTICECTESSVFYSYAVAEHVTHRCKKNLFTFITSFYLFERFYYKNVSTSVTKIVFLRHSASYAASCKTEGNATR